MDTRHVFALATLLLGGAITSVPGQAADRADPDAWAVKINPYLWATRMHGSTRIRDLPEAQVDMSFSDILNTLDAGFMGAMEFQKGRWGILVDSLYMKTSDSVGVASPGGRARVDADMTTSQLMLSSALAYRWLDSPVVSDGFVGIRYNRIKASLDLDASVFGATAELDHTQSVDWVEPFIGLRGRVPLTREVAVVASGDVGGFGLGSDLTTQASLGLSWMLSDQFEAEMGFRYMKVDYDKGDFVYDMENEGPYLGMSYHF
ncbi:porin family protein [Metapseudomonas otitidis]|uniref:hypothetical protein n=1 Tax=Metapseudomonas otitidis TaxID=319939 RepID=UPI00366B9ACA